MQKYFTIVLMFSFLFANSLEGQSYVTPCDADDNPINFGLGEQTETLNGTIEDVVPFITDNTFPNVQDFGIAGADSALFYKLDLDPLTSFLEIEWISGSADDLWVGLIGFDNVCPDVGLTDFGESAYEDPDEVELLSGDIQDGEVTFELCALDGFDFDNVFLWVASSEGEGADFVLEVTQIVRPENSECDDSPEDLGTLNHDGELTSGPFSNINACRTNFAPGADPCALEFNDGASVWFEFTTGDGVGEIDLLLENPSEEDVKIAVLQDQDGLCETFILARYGCADEDNDDEILLENIAVKPNTTYLILFSTDPDDWNDDFEITISACEPPENNIICDAEDVDFNPDPDQTVSFDGNTECAYPFYDDNIDLTSWFDFDCGLNSVERALFYKLNIDPDATRLTIENISNTFSDPMAVQVFILDAPASGCSDLTFPGAVTNAPAEWGNCDFGQGGILEIDLCDIDNADYNNIYLWVASDLDDEGEFTFEAAQEIAPENDLCEDAIDLGQGSDVNFNYNFCGTFSNRGACPGDLTSTDGCIDNFQDEALVWFEFTTGDNVGEVSISVDHNSNSDLDVAVIRADAPCSGLTAIRDDLGCENTTSGSVDLENIPVQSNTLYYVIVNTPEDDWGDFEICIDVCEAPDNNLICDAEEINFNPNPDLSTTVTGTTDCASPFYDDNDALGSWFDFDCGLNDVERAVFYKLEIDEHASELTLSGNITSGDGPLAAQVFILDATPGCSEMNFTGTIVNAPAEWNTCNFSNDDLIIDLCDIDEADYDLLYLWVASDLDDPIDFSVEVSQEIAPYNNLCDDPSAGNRGAGDLGTINHNTQQCENNETNRGACPIDLTGFPTACLEGFEDEPTVWYTFETGDDVEAVDIEVNHPGGNLRVGIFEMDALCQPGGISVPGDFDEYCSAGGTIAEFEQLRVKSNTTYVILVSNPKDDWGDFSICIEACQPPSNFNVCEAENLNFPGAGGYNPDNPAVSTSGTTECAYGFFDDVDLTSLIDFDCGDQYEHAVFYKLDIDPDATKLEIEISTGTAGTMAAQLFFLPDPIDCDNRNFSSTLTFDPDFQDCGFSGTATIEVDFCPFRADPSIDFNELAGQMYLWVATDFDDQGTFDIDIYQEVAPENDDCDNPVDLGTLEEGQSLCSSTETNRGACPILYSGANACFDGFPDEAGVWFSFETGEDVELISVEVNHSNNSEVRLALFALPDGCGETAVIPGDADEYCIHNTTNGNDSIWNILVQQETEYFILVSTPEDDWGDIVEICVRNCEPPVNDKMCDVTRESVPEAIIQPGEEEIVGGVVERNAELVEGTTSCASNLFADFNLTYIDLGCGPDLESAVFYKIELHPDATELTITAEAIGNLNSLAMGLFRIDGDCDDINRDYTIQTWTDPFGEDLIDCDALSGGEVVFDLCGLDEDDFEEMYLWVASERKDQGAFELEMSQKLGPPNDDCGEPFNYGTIASDINEVICLEEINAPRTNIWACPEDYDPFNDIINDLGWDEQECVLDPLEPNFVGVWYEFTTDGEAGRYDLDIVFDDLSTEFRVIIYRIEDGCNEMVIFNCFDDEVGELSFEDSGLLDENGQPTTYKILIYTEEDFEGDFDMCINVKPPAVCDDEPPFFYNHTEVICGLNALEDACLTLQDQNEFLPNEPWSPYTPCNCCVLHNPAWITFVAGDAGELVIDVEISNCIGGFGGEGVQIALYELDCEVEFDTTGQSPGLWPAGPETHISPCNFINSPQLGTITFETDAEPGQVYGIVIDGWNGWNCNIEVTEVLVGGEPPELDSDLLDEPEWDNDGYGFEPGDTICAGAMDVYFSIGTDGVPGACTYTWTLDGEIIGDVDVATEVFLDFPDPGTYEVCVFATNLCESTDPLCVEVIVAPLDPIITMDTICMREEYVWEGPVDFGLLGEGVYGPFNEPGDLDLQFQEENVTNDVGCSVDAFLDLHVVGDNYFNPTQREAVICLGDTYYIPEEGHPEAIPFDATGIYGELPERDVFITQVGNPGSFYECDSFFVLDLAVIALDVLGFLEDCVDSVFTICTESPGVIFPDMGIHVLDTEFTWEWVRLSDGEVLASGDNSDGNVICADLHITDFLAAEQENLQFRINANIDGEPEPDGCDFEIPWTVFLANYLPLTPEVDSDDVFCIGDVIPVEITNDQFIDIDYHWSFSQEPDTIIGDLNGTSLELVFSDPGTVEICVFGQNACASSETVCFEIELNEPPVVFAGDDGTSCDDQFTFDQNTGENGFWTTVSSPGGSTATFAESDSANTTVTVNNPGTYTFRWTEVIPGLEDRCLGTDEITVEFLTPPFPINIAYECDSLGQVYVATFEIVGEAEPYSIVLGDGEIDSVFFTSVEVPDLTLMEVVIEDANGCQSEVIELIERCDCPTAVGQLNPSPLNICDPNCFNTLDHYNPDNEVFVPGQDTVVYFLQTTSAFSTDPDDWVVHNDDGIFCIDDLDIDIDQTYYVYVTVGEIDSLTGFIDLDLDDIFNCTRISQTKPITWRAQPVSMAFDTTTCGTEAGIIAEASVGVGQWTQISGPGTITFVDGAGSPVTDITADECGSYVLQWHEQNFVCADSVEIDVNLNCVPEFDETSLFSNCFEDISYELEFDIISGTPPFEVIEPVAYQGSITGNTFYHPEIPNSGEDLDIFLIEDANGCQVEVVIDVNCDCQPDPGVLGEQINLCITEPNVTVGDFVEDPEGEPGDVGTYVLHTAPGNQPGDILDIDVNGQFTFNPDTMVCGVTYYISYAIGPPDADGNTNLMDGCTRYSVGQPVLWYCEPTVDAGDDVTVCGTGAAQLNGSSTFGDGQWSGGAGTLLNPDDPSTSYLPDSTEFGGTVTLTYTTLADDGICPDISDQMTVIVEQPRFADAGPDQIFCEVEDVQLSADSEGVSGMWSGGEGTFDDPTSQTAVYSPDPSEQGTIITLTWTTDAGDECPEVSDQMTIEIVDDLTAVPGDDFVACFLSTNLDAELAGNLNGEWSSTDTGVEFADVNDPNTEVTVPELGTYCFTWTVSIGDCEDENEVCVTFVDAPVLVDTIIECNDIATEYFVTIIVEGGDPDSYTANGEPFTGNSFETDWITSGESVTVTITDVNDCEPLVVVVENECECLTEIGEMDDPDAVTLCEDQTFDFSTFYDPTNEFLDPNDIRVYLLHDGDMNNVGNIIVENTSGVFGFQGGMNLEESYWVTVAVGDEVGTTNAIDFNDPCLLYSTGVEVIWYEYPDAGIMQPDILTCAVEEVTITASTEEAPHIAYNWSGPGVVAGQDERTVTVNQVGVYTLEITDTRANCTSTNTVEVEGDFEDPIVSIDTPDPLTCADTEVEVDGSASSAGNFTYEWQGPSVVAGGNTPVATVSEPGTYTLIVTNNDNGCVSEASMNVIEDVDFPEVNLSVDAELDCSTDLVTISGAGSSQGPAFEYSWSEVPNTGANLVGATDEINAQADQSGLYVLEVLNTDNQCLSMDTIEVIEITDVVTGAIIETDGINCFGDTDGVIEVVDVVGGTAPYLYSFDGGQNFGTSPVITGLNPGSYTVAIQDDRGCLYDTTLTLIEPALLQVDLGPTVVVELGENATLQAEVNVDEEAIVTWDWNPPVDPTCENCPQQVFMPERETFVQVTVTDTSGCMATAGVNVLVRVTREVYLPNAFSPNQDGINDFFGVYSDPLRIERIVDFKIFNRWGEKVFDREDIPFSTELDETNAWDGTFNGEDMNPDIFVYYIVIEFADGVEETFRGDFMLFR